jgi:hypothetical protein
MSPAESWRRTSDAKTTMYILNAIALMMQMKTSVSRSKDSCREWSSRGFMSGDYRYAMLKSTQQ